MQSIPVTVKRSIEIAGLFVLATIIIKAQLIIIPLFLAFFVSVALLPVYRFFYSKNIPKTEFKATFPLCKCMDK
jgi:predicted PurR-regulated permease PerM